MNACAVLETLQREGIAVRREGDRLKLKPATGTVPADLIELARAHKPELLQALPDTADPRASLYRLADAEGLPRGIVDRLTDADLDPDNGAHLLDDAGLRRWLHVLAENARMRQGIAPPTWTQPGYCERCGPVRLWVGAPLRVLGCPWCAVRRAGGHLPRPSVTCATCTHQQPRPDTSDAGMHGCTQGHPLHYANEPHTCTDWKPNSFPQHPTGACT